MKAIFRLFICSCFLVVVAATFSAKIVVTDDIQNTVILAKPPLRVVSLAPNITETMFALGAGNLLVGRTNYCNYPPEARKIPSVGGFSNPDLEKIVALKPDLVLMTNDGNPKEIAHRLKSLSIQFFVAGPEDLNSVSAFIEKIGLLLGKTGEGNKLAGQFSDRVASIKKKAMGLSRPAVLFLYGQDPMVSVSSGTFADDLLRAAGGRNIFGTSAVKYPLVGWDQIIAARPEVIFISDMGHADGGKRQLAAFANHREIPAAVKGKIFIVNGDIIDRPGPRLVDGLELLFMRIHPEAGP